MERITNSDLEHLVKQINKATGSPFRPWGKDEQGRPRANVGNYHVSGAYSGVKLQRMCNKSGGCDNISADGYGTKRQLYAWMQAFLAGLACVGNALPDELITVARKAANHERLPK